MKERISVSKILSILSGLIGVYIIISGAQGIELKTGVIFSIVSVILWPISSVIVKKISRTYDPIIITAMAFWIATVLSVPCSLTEITSTKNYDIFTPQSIACIVYLGIIGTAVQIYSEISVFQYSQEAKKACKLNKTEQTAGGSSTQ